MSGTATVTDELLQEGSELLAKNDSEGLHRLGDRVVSVEPDNWYGLYVRGCAYAIDGDFNNMVASWTQCAAHVDDERTMTDLQPNISKYLAHCILHITDGRGLDVSKISGLLDEINDKLPESDDEFLVNDALDDALGHLKDGAASNALLTYYTYKAVIVASFRSYVELPIFIGFFEKLDKMARLMKEVSDPKTAGVLDASGLFVDEMVAAMRAAVDNCPAEDLQKIEEYWLEHKKDPYLAHLMQAYQMSNAVATAGRFISKIAKKAMLTSVQAFIKVYLSPKIEKGQEAEASE